MKACDKVNSTALQIHHFRSLVLVPISDGLAYLLRHVQTKKQCDLSVQFLGHCQTFFQSLLIQNHLSYGCSVFSSLICDTHFDTYGTYNF